MLQALQQTVQVGAGGRIELIAPECPEGINVQVIVLVPPKTQSLEPMQPSLGEIGEGREGALTAAIKKIQARVRKYVPQERSLVDELIAERRAEAEGE